MTARKPIYQGWCKDTKTDKAKYPFCCTYHRNRANAATQLARLEQVESSMLESIYAQQTAGEQVSEELDVWVAVPTQLRRSLDELVRLELAESKTDGDALLARLTWHGKRLFPLRTWDVQGSTRLAQVISGTCQLNQDAGEQLAAEACESPIGFATESRVTGRLGKVLSGYHKWTAERLPDTETRRGYFRLAEWRR